MTRGKYAFIISFILMSILLVLFNSRARAGTHEGHQHEGHEHHMKAEPSVETGKQPVFAAMPGPGEKVPIGNGGYLIFGFDKKPKMGTVILKVAVYTPAGEKDTSFEVLVDCGMPSMRGAHETGDLPCKLSKKGDYLLPINIVMPGDWEIRLTIKKDGRVVNRGSYKFDV